MSIMAFGASVLSALGMGGAAGAAAGAGAAGAGAAGAGAAGASTLGSMLGGIGNAAQAALGTSALNSAGTGLAVGGSQGGMLGGLQSMMGGSGGGTSSGSSDGGMSDPAMGLIKMLMSGPNPAPALPDTAGSMSQLIAKTDAGKASNVPKSNGFMGDALQGAGLYGEDGKFDGKNLGGMIGSMLGDSIKKGGSIPQAPEINFGDISVPQVQQAIGDKPWADNDLSAYLRQLMGG